MDFIKGNEEVKIDPSGIDISGAGHIIIDSNSVTGDISFNDKVSVSNNFDVTGNINISGNNNFVITNDGNVGIGTSIPNAKLEIEGTNTGIRLTDNRSNYGAQGNVEMGKIEWYSKEASFDNDYDPMCKISALSENTSVAPDCRISFFTGLNGVIDEKMSINPSGNVGIGTNAPEVALSVYGPDICGNPWDSTNNPLIMDIQPVLKLYRKSKMRNSDGTGIFNDSAMSIDLQRPNNSSLSYPYTKAHFNLTSGTASNSIETNNTVMTLSDSGYVGIGTSEPDFPLTIGTGRQLYFNASGYVGTQYLTYDNKFAFTNYINGVYSTGVINANGYGSNSIVSTISLRATRSIWTEQYLLSSSDKRIKTDISLVVDDTALNRVNALESKEYNYIDPERRQPMKTIGFIAQEVKDVIPNAVSLQKKYIPDEMRLITEPTWSQDASNNWLLDIPDLDMSGAFTGKAKFYVSNDPSGNDEVCKEVEIKEVPDNSQPLLFPSATKFVAEFDQSWNNVFFYGKEVHDFHTIDKNQIFALHHSAIQELSRRNEKLQEDNDTKTSKIASLESRVEALEEAILAMQSLIQGLQ